MGIMMLGIINSAMATQIIDPEILKEKRAFLKILRRRRGMKKRGMIGKNAVKMLKVIGLKKDQSIPN